MATPHRLTVPHTKTRNAARRSVVAEDRPLPGPIDHDRATAHTHPLTDHRRLDRRVEMGSMSKAVSCRRSLSKQADTVKGITEQAGRDCKAYELARDYLLELPGVTDEVLQRYLSPPRSDTPSTMAEVFLRLLLSLRNKNMMATVIPAKFVHSLGRVLNSFDPVTTTQRFTSADDLLDTIEKLRPPGQFRKVPGGLWPLFARGTLSGARFLGQFTSGPDFLAWVQTFDDDSRKRAALPLLLSKEIDGFGFALGCDFLKELGFFNFAKPDVHVKAITKGLKLSIETATDYAVFKTVVRIAAHCDKTPYDVDKLFWLVGSGRFYLHPSIGRVATDRDGFIQKTSRVLG